VKRISFGSISGTAKISATSRCTCDITIIDTHTGSRREDEKPEDPLGDKREKEKSNWFGAMNNDASRLHKKPLHHTFFPFSHTQSHTSATRLRLLHDGYLVPPQSPRPRLHPRCLYRLRCIRRPRPSSLPTRLPAICALCHNCFTYLLGAHLRALDSADNFAVHDFYRCFILRYCYFVVLYIAISLIGYCYIWNFIDILLL
jgi:hypothetical protein